MHKHVSIGILLLGLPVGVLAISLIILATTDASQSDFTSVWALAAIMEAIFLVPSILLFWSVITNKPIFSPKVRSTPKIAKFTSKRDLTKAGIKSDIDEKKEEESDSDEIDFTF